MGGFFGAVGSGNSYQVLVINSYSNVFLNRSAGNMAGILSAGTGTLNLTNSFFNNENGYPSIVTNNSRLIRDAVGLNSSQLSNEISTNFTFPWCGIYLCNGKIN